MNREKVDILIIGAGPAGLAAAIAAREDGIQSLLVLERESQPGGILRQCIHNGPGQLLAEAVEAEPVMDYILNNCNY